MKLNPRDARSISIGIEFVVSVMLGLGAGYWADKKLGTAPWLMLVGIVLGSAAGFRSLLRFMKQATAQEQRAEREEQARRSDEHRPHGHFQPPSPDEPNNPNDRQS